VPTAGSFTTTGRLALGTALLALCGLVFWSSITAGISDFDATQAAFVVNSHLEQNRPLDIPTLERAQEGLEDAIRWNRINGVAYRNLALVHQMRLSLPWRDLAERDRHLNEGLTAAARAVAEQPTSGFAYSIFAAAKHLRGEHDAAFRRALALAAHYSPWEPGVQVNVIDTGLRAWIDLDEPTKDVVRQTIGRALESQPEQAIAALKARRDILPGCPALRVRIPGICA